MALHPFGDFLKLISPKISRKNEQNTRSNLIFRLLLQGGAGKEEAISPGLVSIPPFVHVCPDQSPDSPLSCPVLLFRLT